MKGKSILLRAQSFPWSVGSRRAFRAQLFSPRCLIIKYLHKTNLPYPHIRHPSKRQITSCLKEKCCALAKTQPELRFPRRPQTALRGRFARNGNPTGGSTPGAKPQTGSPNRSFDSHAGPRLLSEADSLEEGIQPEVRHQVQGPQPGDPTVG
jgi:hypothetical protein